MHNNSSFVFESFNGGNLRRRKRRRSKKYIGWSPGDKTGFGDKPANETCSPSNHDSSTLWFGREWIIRRHSHCPFFFFFFLFSFQKFTTTHWSHSKTVINFVLPGRRNQKQKKHRCFLFLRFLFRQR